jgi:hypothetical protein
LTRPDQELAAGVGNLLEQPFGAQFGNRSLLHCCTCRPVCIDETDADNNRLRGFEQYQFERLSHTGRSERTRTVYHSLDPQRNVRPTAWDPTLPVIWSLDFNVNPMASVIA